MVEILLHQLYHQQMLLKQVFISFQLVNKVQWLGLKSLISEIFQRLMEQQNTLLELKQQIGIQM